jgi:hypothetical protein
MALTYTESATLMTDQDFRGRIKVSALKYSDFIFGEPPDTPAHNTRFKWAQNCASQPDITATQLQPNVVMDAAVQTDGAAITDVGLQSSVETVINKLL